MTKTTRFILYFLLSILLCALLTVSFLFCKKSVAHQLEMEEGLKILKQEKAKIYISGSYLNVDIKKWQDQSFTIGNKYPFSVGKRKFVYGDNWPNTLIVADIQDTEKKISIEVGGGGVVTSYDSSNVALSNDESRLAYVFHPDTQWKNEPDMVICDLSSTEKRIYPKIGITQEICWSEDDKSIIFCDYRDIYKLNLIDGNLEYLADGWLPKVLPDGSLGFWHYKEPNTLCCKMDLNTGKITELFFLEDYLRGADWSPDGRYVIASVFSDFWFIRECVGLPILIDTKTGRKYRLPETTNSKHTEKKFKTGEDVMWK